MNGAPAKPMSGTGEVGPDEADRLEQRPTAASGSNGPEPGHVARATGSARSMTGPTPWPDVEGHAEPRERRRDVGEQDRRVDAEAADRLEGDLGAQRRVAGDLEQRCARSRIGPVLGQRAPGLAHEPDGGRVDGFAAAGPKVAIGARVDGPRRAVAVRLEARERRASRS